MLDLEQVIQLPFIENIYNQKNVKNLIWATDSRKFNTENAFIALRGEKFDGFDYAKSVLNKDCDVIVFEKNEKNTKSLKSLKDEYPYTCFIEVSSVVDFLHILANKISKNFYDKGGKIICISGSNGKTTTKEMTAFILEKLGFKTIKTLANNNNHIGVPLTLFQIDNKTEYAIVELGSNHPGEIPKLCEIVDPNIGYTTNIGHTHLEFFENLENVFKEEAFLNIAVSKSEKTPKLFFQNNYDEYLAKINNSDAILLNGDDNKVKADFNKCELTINGKQYEISNPNLTGKHNFFNIGAACLMVHQVSGQSIEKIISISKIFEPTGNRSQWIGLKSELNIFLDAYNANPSSMKEAIEGFEMSVSEKNISPNEVLYILGDMNELGSNAKAFHTEIGNFVSTKKISNLWVVGRFAEDYKKGCSSAVTFKDTASAKLKFLERLSEFKYVFIKGSRTLQLESIIDIT